MPTRSHVFISNSGERPSRFEEVVRGLGVSVYRVRLAPRSDLVLPTDDGAAYRSDARQARVVSEIPSNTGDVLGG